jgi:very-short-patch-repair endonuclease
MNIFDFLTSSGRINSIKTRESWINEHRPEFLNMVNEYCRNNNIKRTRFVEKLWYYLNNEGEIKKCQCGNDLLFRGLNKGFGEYCSKKCSNGSDKVKNKKIDSNIKKYGVENPYQSSEIIEKIKETNIKRHGVPNPMFSDNIKKKMMDNSINLNGTPWALSKGGTAHSKKRENLYNDFVKKYSDLKLIQYSEEKFGVCVFNKEECGHDFSINKWQAHQRKSQGVEMCTICNPIGSYNYTIWEEEIEKFLGTHNIKFVKNNRSLLKGLELDFYCEDHHVAIELDGLYWHSLKFKDQNYHLNKTKRCEELGIQLIHIFEDEWIYKKEIVKSRLLNIFKKSEVKIFARKCTISKIDSSNSLQFLEENHIQGAIPSKYRYGLFYGAELVSVMTFGPLRRALGSTPEDGVYEMYRLCNKRGVNIVGGAGKLLNKFIMDYSPKSIISYADRRWSTGGVYRALGFNKIGETSPNFWYVKGDRRIHRFSYTKKKVADLIKSDDFNMIDALIQLGLEQIYDSGNLKFQINPMK